MFDGDVRNQAAVVKGERHLLGAVGIAFSDDQDFAITHVIRAVEHLSNTPRQVFIAQSLGYPLPAYAHLPYVAEPGSSNKLSKRKLDKYLKNPDFKKLYESQSAFRSDAFLWWQVAEYTFDSFSIRSRGKA